MYLLSRSRHQKCPVLRRIVLKVDILREGVAPFRVSKTVPSVMPPDGALKRPIFNVKL